MKKFKLLAMLLMTSLLMSANAFAESIGVVNYGKVLSSYNYAKEIFKTLDNKSTELQQYMLDKQKQYKNIANPVERKNFEDKTQREYNAKVDALVKLKNQKEDEVNGNIISTIKRVATQKKIDMVVEASVIFTGGTDITNEVITALNNK